MGNDTSAMPDLKIVDNAVEVTEYWTHKTALLTKCDNVQELSLFTSQNVATDSFWESKSPLQIYAKNLMLHRHPCILKYVSSWKASSTFHLAVENVRPLTHELINQSGLQVCIGLHSILKSLVFLHEKANASHNNVCTASIYVTNDGSWKLGGLEFLCKKENLTPEYLTKIRPHRYDKAVHPNEDKYTTSNLIKHDVIDQYAFGILVEEILQKRLDDNIPALKQFFNTCKHGLQSPEADNRPNLSTLLTHSFFTHEFMSLHSFLTELPLKTDQEKNIFFSTLLEKLHSFSEKVIAANLGHLLLSRLVLLDATAREMVLPFLLHPKDDHYQGGVHQNVFTKTTFKEHLVHKLIQIFKVTDIQIRELLLLHFKNFADCFSKDELTNHILPELLLGIKDTNDNLVAMTLRALADLVPILGATTVIGGKRAKLFSDGRPINHAKLQANSVDGQHMASPCHKTDFVYDNSNCSYVKGPGESSSQNSPYLPERPSPDGGEDSSSVTTDAIHAICDELDWSDWDIQETSNDHFVPLSASKSDPSSPNMAELRTETDEESLKMKPSQEKSRRLSCQQSLPDISELDIKNQSTKNSKSNIDDFNFFEDMEPVIESTNKFLVNGDVLSNEHLATLSIVKSKLNINSDLITTEDGWGEDLDWSVDNN